MTAVFPDPAQEFLSQDPTVLREPDPLQPRDIPVAGIAAGLGAAYLGYRHHMRNKVQDEVTKLGPGVTRRALLAVVGSVWQAYIPSWVSKVVPYLVAGYIEGMREAATGEVPEPVLRKIAEGYAKELGEHINNVSQEAMISGFNAQVNRKVPPAMAARRVTNAYGVTRRTMNALVNVWTAKEEQRLTDLPLPSAKEERAKYIIETQNVLRSQQIGETEHWTAKTQAKQVVWMYGQENGVIPKNARRVWITAHDERVCPTCGPMDGKSAKIGEKFTTSDGDFWTPPAHVRCRCDVALDLTPTEDMQDALDALLQAEKVSKARAGDPYDRDSRGRFSPVESRRAGGSRARPVKEREAEVDELLAQVNEALKVPVAKPRRRILSQKALEARAKADPNKIPNLDLSAPSLEIGDMSFDLQIDDPNKMDLSIGGPKVEGGYNIREVIDAIGINIPTSVIAGPHIPISNEHIGNYIPLEHPLVLVMGGVGNVPPDYDQKDSVYVDRDNIWYQVNYEVNDTPEDEPMHPINLAIAKVWERAAKREEKRYFRLGHEDVFFMGKDGMLYKVQFEDYMEAWGEAQAGVPRADSSRVKLHGYGEMADHTTRVRLYDIAMMYGMQERVAETTPQLYVAMHGLPGETVGRGKGYSNPGQWRIVGSAHREPGFGGLPYQIHYVEPFE